MQGSPALVVIQNLVGPQRRHFELLGNSAPVRTTKRRDGGEAEKCDAQCGSRHGENSRKDLRTLRAALRWAHDQKYIRDLPVFKGKFLREEDRMPVVIPLEEFHAMLNAVDALEGATDDYLGNVSDDPDRGSAIGVDYMMLAGFVTGAWLMGRSALAANRHLQAGSNDEFYRSKISTAIYFAERILPRSQSLASMIAAGSASTMAIDADDL